MSFPRYPKYKDSGLEWLREIPGHWAMKRLRYISNIRKGRLPSATSPVATSDTDLPYLSMEYLRGESSDPTYVQESPNLIRANNGDLLLLWDGSNAGEFLRAKQGVVSSTVALIEPRNVLNEFLFFACKARERELKDQTIGMGIPHVSGDELRGFSLPCPACVDEQTRIAAFLDCETLKIDGLVAEQQRLIDLLNEKRQAVISHAVTKGLNPAAPMKSSGIEWLGEVPEHWTVTKLGHVFAELPCYGVLVPDFDPNGVPMLRINDMTANRIDRDQLVTISQQLSDQYARSIVQTGDLIISVVGQLGVTSVINEDLAGVNLSRNVARVQFGKRMHSEFARWLFTSTLFQHYTDLVCVGTAQRLLNMSALTAFIAACPPTTEQRNITSFLERETSKLDALIAEALRAITLLQERRTALISAAVTGQIDVRHLAEAGAA